MYPPTLGESTLHSALCPCPCPCPCPYAHAHVPICSYAHVPICTYAHAHVPICSYAHVPICSYAHVPMCPCAHMPICSYAHVPMCPCAHVPICSYAHMPICPYPAQVRWRAFITLPSRYDRLCAAHPLDARTSGFRPFALASGCCPWFWPLPLVLALPLSLPLVQALRPFKVPAFLWRFRPVPVETLAQLL